MVGNVSKKWFPFSSRPWDDAVRFLYVLSTLHLPRASMVTLLFWNKAVSTSDGWTSWRINKVNKIWGMEKKLMPVILTFIQKMGLLLTTSRGRIGFFIGYFLSIWIYSLLLVFRYKKRIGRRARESIKPSLEVFDELIIGLLSCLAIVGAVYWASGNKRENGAKNNFCN